MASPIDILRAVHWTDQVDGVVHKKPEYPIRLGFVGQNALLPEVHHPEQVHKAHIVEAREETTGPRVVESRRVPADGIITTERGLKVGVETADCLPLLICDADRPWVAAIHAGWRGLTLGIVGQAVGRAVRDGASADRLLCFIGPCISPGRYEVGDDVVAACSNRALRLSPEQLAFALSKGRNDRWQFDLATAAVFDLCNHGVLPNRIGVLRSCTFESTDLWYSYRRSGADAGRNWSWIQC